MRAFRIALIFWLPLIAWFLVIHSFSATPEIDLPKVPIPHIDKIFHFILYLILGALMIRAFDSSEMSPVADIESGHAAFKDDFNVGLAKLAILAIIISACYGGFDELYQRQIPGRSCDLFDFIADCAGACSGVIIYIFDVRNRMGQLCRR